MKRLSSEILELSDSLINVGHLRIFPGHRYPFFYSFTENGPLHIVSELSTTGPNLAQRFVRALLARHLSNCFIHVYDPLGFGAHFDQLSRLGSEFKNQRVHTEIEGLRNTIHELRLRITAVNQDILPRASAGATLSQYLRKNTKSNEKVHIFLINSFPYRWDKNTVSLFFDILRMGPRAGVYPIIIYDPQAVVDVYDRTDLSNLLKQGTCIFGHSFRLEIVPRLIDAAPNYIELTGLDSRSADVELETIREAAVRDSEKEVRIESEVLALAAASNSTSSGVKIPIGKRGDGELQFFELGDRQGCYHCLIGGATGSGKTVLLHNIILNGSAVYEPHELQFCLLDYKEGTEFQVYRENPNVRVLSIESEAAFGLSFLSYCQSLLSKRGDLFKSIGVSNFHDAREMGYILPRLLIVIDEFQVMLSDSFRGQAEVEELIDDISKRGRSFGVHLVLCSQSLAGVRLRSSTVSQIALRMVMRISRDDSERFLMQGNLEPSFFRRPGQAIYNGASGIAEDNIYFNVAMCDNTSRQLLSACILRPYEAQTPYELPKKVFDPYLAPLLMDAIEASWNTKDILLGEAYYMGDDKYLRMAVDKKEASGILIASRSPEELSEFSAIICAQLRAPALVLATDEEFEVFRRTIDLIDPEIEAFRLKEMDDVERHMGDLDYRGHEDPTPLVALNLANLKEFRGSGYSRSESADKLVRYIQLSIECGIIPIVSFTNRIRASDTLDLRSAFPELRHKIILSNGTDFEDELLSRQAPTIRSGMGIHVSEDYKDGYAYFRKVEVKR